MKKGTIWMSIGMLFLIAAFGLTVYNILDNKKAKDASEKVSMQIAEEISIQVEENKDEEPLYKNHPDIEIPSIELDGNRYIGLLEIPVLNISLPIIKEWSYPNLKIAPCRYEGSAYTGDLIIAAHNYNSHFGGLKTLKPGDEVKFWDVDGNLFAYEVASTEVLGGTAVEDMLSGEWDLTLFTCTYGGRTRVTVRLVQNN